jgi:hypothetical protein
MAYRRVIGHNVTVGVTEVVNDDTAIYAQEE